MKKRTISSPHKETGSLHIPQKILIILLMIIGAAMAGFTVRAAKSAPPAASTTCNVPSASYGTINTALADGSCSTIKLAAGIYTEELNINRDVTISGNQSFDTAIQAAATQGTASSRVIRVFGGTTAVLEDMTVQFGNQHGASYPDDVGGGILNEGTLTLAGVIVYQNSGDHGGGIFNSGTLTVTNSNTDPSTISLIRENTANNDGGGINNNGTGKLWIENAQINFNDSTFQGGGIYTFGEVHLQDVRFEQNEAVFGGGLYMGGSSSVRIEDSYIQENLAGTGAGIANRGIGAMLTMTGGWFLDNIATDTGGGLYNEGLTETVSVAFFGNEAGSGGGIRVAGGAVKLTSAIVNDNHALATRGGGILVQGGEVEVIRSLIQSNDAALDGGGLYISGSGSQNYISESTISSNDANGGKGGGLYMSSGSVQITNSTISNNDGITDGGGIMAFAGSLLIANSTIVFNSTDGGGNATGGVGLNTPDATIRNSIILINFSPNSDSRNCWATGTFIFGLGTNLLGNGDCIDHFAGSGSIITTTDPSAVLSFDLVDNGGPTFTHALLPGSLALDREDVCPDTNGQPLQYDQRGVPRVINGACDLGAFELGSAYYLPIMNR